jgi:predicted membrane GTPase involved in stress response
MSPFVEVTPGTLRLRKALLHAGELQKLARAAERG